ncbi:hypothetical protein FNV43_RR24527 [Rhamnella rubrinervis]|uniref:Uncharacterized protein n=1 Tax=Rhamnella rubrinervis TaxID=2594499 RepID=A0A8K0DT89_9ROSA|nr:hypothetical protein FNV43_RR24527 [Rhamnella rubrinervis]
MVLIIKLEEHATFRSAHLRGPVTFMCGPNEFLCGSMSFLHNRGLFLSSRSSFLYEIDDTFMCNGDAFLHGLSAFFYILAFSCCKSAEKRVRIEGRFAMVALAVETLEIIEHGCMNNDPFYKSCFVLEESWDSCRPITYLLGFYTKGANGGEEQNFSFFTNVLKENSITKKALTWSAKLSPDKLSQMEIIGGFTPQNVDNLSFDVAAMEIALSVPYNLIRCMISVSKIELQSIPPCIKKATYLDFTKEQIRSYNELVVLVQQNILMADWYDPSHVEITNVGQDIQETMDILVENGLDPNLEEYAFIKYNLLYWGYCLRMTGILIGNQHPAVKLVILKALKEANKEDKHHKEDDSDANHIDECCAMTLLLFFPRKFSHVLAMFLVSKTNKWYQSTSDSRRFVRERIHTNQRASIFA